MNSSIVFESLGGRKDSRGNHIRPLRSPTRAIRVIDGVRAHVKRSQPPVCSSRTDLHPLYTYTATTRIDSIHHARLRRCSHPRELPLTLHTKEGASLLVGARSACTTRWSSHAEHFPSLAPTRLPTQVAIIFPPIAALMVGGCCDFLINRKSSVSSPSTRDFSLTPQALACSTQQSFSPCSDSSPDTWVSSLCSPGFLRSN